MYTIYNKIKCNHCGAKWSVIASQDENILGFECPECGRSGVAKVLQEPVGEYSTLMWAIKDSTSKIN